MQLRTVSIRGVKQFYLNLLRFPVIYESDVEISFQPTKFFALTFIESLEPIAPAHFAFEVPYSVLNSIINQLRETPTPISLLQWSDGKWMFLKRALMYIFGMETNLLEILAHPYIKEDIIDPSGALKVLYLREVGFPVDHVVLFP